MFTNKVKLNGNRIKNKLGFDITKSPLMYMHGITNQAAQIFTNTRQKQQATASSSFPTDTLVLQTNEQLNKSKRLQPGSHVENLAYSFQLNNLIYIMIRCTQYVCIVQGSTYLPTFLPHLKSSFFKAYNIQHFNFFLFFLPPSVASTPPPSLFLTRISLIKSKNTLSTLLLVLAEVST